MEVEWDKRKASWNPWAQAKTLINLALPPILMMWVSCRESWCLTIIQNIQGRGFWETQLSQAELTPSKVTAVAYAFWNSDEDRAQSSSGVLGMFCLCHLGTSSTYLNFMKEKKAVYIQFGHVSICALCFSEMYTFKILLYVLCRRLRKPKKRKKLISAPKRSHYRHFDLPTCYSPTCKFYFIAAYSSLETYYGHFPCRPISFYDRILMVV